MNAFNVWGLHKRANIVKKHDFLALFDDIKKRPKMAIFRRFSASFKNVVFSCFSTSIFIDDVKVSKKGVTLTFLTLFLTFWKIFFKICRKLSKLLGNYGRNSRKYPTGPQICRVSNSGHITFRNIGPKSHYTYWIRDPPNFRGPLKIDEKARGAPPQKCHAVFEA